MPQSSFYADGETYSTSTVTSNDTPGSATPSQAPSSFFKSGGIYNALAEESTTLTLFQQLLASTQTAQAAAAASATAAAASAASMPSASSSSPLIDGTASPGTANSWSRGDHVHPTDTSRAPLASPALTGVPTAPTATAGTNTTQLATTAFVLANGGGSPATVAPLMDGTAAVGTSTLYARQDHVHPSDTSRAPLASPTFTGTPAAPTATAGDSTTQLATTAFVTTALTPLRKKSAADYYVATTGSDTTGTGASGSPWATIQKAINTLLTLDLAGQFVTVHVAAGTYTAGFSLTAAFVGGTVLVTGDTTTPSNVLISPASGGNPFEVSGVGNQITVSGFKTVSAGGAIHLYAHDGGLLFLQTKWEFGAATSGSHITATRGGAVQISNSTAYTISGSASFHFNINAASRVVCNATTVTLTGTPAFSTFAQIAAGGNLQIISTTFTGSATGTKNTVTTGGGVDTAGGSAANALFPGSVSGTTTTPGWWS